MKSRVVLIPCTNYESEPVYQAVCAGLELLGGITHFVRTDERVLLKPNLLSAALPEKAVTTHPAVFSAMGRLLRESGCTDLRYGDSPGRVTPEKGAQAAGIASAACALDIFPADFGTGKSMPFPAGKTAKRFYICRGVLESQALINICKMKTHGLERVTGAVKNLYGCICGMHKGAGHARFPDAGSFAGMLADLHVYLRPRLHVMDGIFAMEGNGPAAGTPIFMGVLLFSADPVALDAVFCQLVHLNPALVPTNIRAANAGVGVWREEEIELLTPEGVLSMAAAVEKWGNPRFDVRRENTSHISRPYAAREKCTRCGICAECCPLTEKAITLTVEGFPQMDYTRCIRCFCCQEMCPSQAIGVRSFLIGG